MADFTIRPGCTGSHQLTLDVLRRYCLPPLLDSASHRCTYTHPPQPVSLTFATLLARTTAAALGAGSRSLTAQALGALCGCFWL